MKTQFNNLIAATGLALLALGGTASSQTTAGPSQGPNGNYYEVVYFTSSTMAWSAARTAAAARTPPAGLPAGHLATITDEREDVFIESLRQQALSAAGVDPHDATAARALWIGGSQGTSQASVGAGWQWLNSEGAIGAGSGYTNWLPGEPNDWNTVGFEDDQENYLSMGFEGTFSWNDSGGSLPGYVVEYEFAATATNSIMGATTDGHRYEIFLENRTRTWADAALEARCRSRGGLTGHLATITSQEEDEKIEALRTQLVAAAGFDPAAPNTHPPLWVGGWQKPNQSSPSRGWNWINRDGTVGGTVGGSGYGNWLVDEPNDWPGAGVEDNQENHLAVGLNGTFSWNDSGGPLTGYVVEYEPVSDFFPVRRSTRYDGNNRFEFDYQPGFNRNLETTVEAWVYREDATRREALLSHGASGYCFGFVGDRLHFKRVTGPSFLSSAPVPAKQWTHVAATYDRSSVRYFINGAQVGAVSSDPVPELVEDGDFPLLVGGSAGASTRFRGAIDELRLWSVVRTEAQIRNNRFSELHSGAGLEAVWAAGGQDEVLSGARGRALPAEDPPVHQRSGILPADLVVPEAAMTPKFDGNVDPSTEYAGAEEMVIRYNNGPSFKDARAYLVHTKEYLYVGIEGARLPSGGSPSASNALQVYIDSAGETLGFDEDCLRAQLHLDNSQCDLGQVGGFLNPITQQYIYNWTAANPTSVEFQCHQGTEREGELSTTRDVEFRFHRSLLGEFDRDAIDRLAIHHADHGGPGGESWTPAGGDETTPARWAKVRYYPARGDTLPRVNLAGSVRHPYSDAPLAGVEVTLSGDTQEYGTKTTSAAGSFFFTGVDVGINDSLRLQITVPEGTVTHPPVVGSGGVQPLTVGEAEVIFPGCSQDSCEYARVHFKLELPLPAVTLSAPEPGETYPPVTLREGDPGESTGTIPIEVAMDNAHEDLEFFLIPEDCRPDPTAFSGCEEGVDYFRLQATAVPGSGEATTYRLTIADPFPTGTPDDPFSFLPRNYWIAAHDLWSRPDNDPATASSWRYAPEPVLVTEPPYELLHGFAFPNRMDAHDFDDYRAAFQDQICDPLTMVGTEAFAPLYLEATGGGECVGMVVTASQFARGKLTSGLGTSLYLRHGDVRYGNGFQDLSLGDPYFPARFKLSPACSPVPLNIWAWVKANHGVQFSSEFIAELLSQFDIGEHGIVTNHALVLNELRPPQSPLERLLCIRNGDMGHCVQPLRVIDTVRDASGAILPNRHDIEVWDPNHPEETRTIEITIEPGQPDHYSYDGFEEPWEGNWLLVIEIDPIWDGERHVPSIDAVGRDLDQFGVSSLSELLQLIVSGDAEPMVTSPVGSVGWDGSGNFSESGTATVALPQFNWLPDDAPPLGHYPATLVHRLAAGTPEVTLHNRGESYKVHSSHQGTMFQYFVGGGAVGSDDTLGFLTPNGAVGGASFTAGGSGRAVAGGIALCRGGASYPAAFKFEPLPVPIGGALTMRCLPNEAGVELLNDTATTLQPTWRIVQPTAAGGGAGPEEVELPRVTVPAGAAMTIRTVDGLDFDDVFVDIDLLRDGSPDFSYVHNGETGQWQQMAPGSGPELTFALKADIVNISWDEVPGWELALSEDLRRWDLALRVQVDRGRASWSGPRTAARGFFKFVRQDP